MSINRLVADPGRLTILATLASAGRQEFVALRQTTHLTDGNLASHARRLQTAGLIQIDKQFRNAKPVTSFTLTPQGRQALELHVRQLVAAISVKPPAAGELKAEPAAEAADEWVD